MKEVRKPRKQSTKVVAVPEGLQIEDEVKFYKDVCGALKVCLGIDFLVLAKTQVGQRQLVYIREPSSPTVQGRKGPQPVLPLFIDERQSAWLVVEFESEYGKPLVLKHISLKLWQGATVDASHLCFRAEWDVRDAESRSHAQPHWNIHAPRGFNAAPKEEKFSTYAVKNQPNTIDSLIEFERSESSIVIQQTSEPESDYGLSAGEMHKFHFAMAANWHASEGCAGPKISTTQEVVSWISSCAQYMKHQFAFVMGTQTR